MTITSSQKISAPSSIEKLKGTIKALFPLLARTDTAQAYRERLCAYERNMFDKFYGFKESRPDHQVFVGIAESCRPDQFVSYETVAEAKQAIEALQSNKYGPQPFIAFDLRKSFQEQWTQKPDGSDFSDLLKKSPISRVPDLALYAPRHATVKSSYNRT